MTAHDCAGWFGKIPSAGDFITRALPRSFVEPWDEWLSAELAQAQRALGERWLEGYRRAPSWCFVLGEEVLDARVWRGVLVPSFDRVGREFPLTIVYGSASRLVTATPQWWRELAVLGRQAVAPAGSAARLEALAGILGNHSGDTREASPGSERTYPAVPIPRAGSSSWWFDEEVTGTWKEPRPAAGLPMRESFLEWLTPARG